MRNSALASDIRSSTNSHRPPPLPPPSNERAPLLEEFAIVEISDLLLGDEVVLSTPCPCTRALFVDQITELALLSDIGEIHTRLSYPWVRRVRSSSTSPDFRSRTHLLSWLAAPSACGWRRRWIVMIHRRVQDDPLVTILPFSSQPFTTCQITPAWKPETNESCLRFELRE